MSECSPRLGEESAAVSIVIPVLDDNRALCALLCQISAYDQQHKTELLSSVVIADGSNNNSAQAVAKKMGTHYVASPASRGSQIAAGVAQARHPWLWVLHADSVLSEEALDYVCRSLAGPQPQWGRFDIVIPGHRIIAGMMNWRSRLTRVVTGDQGLFVHRSLLTVVGGYPEIPLMEDIAISKKLKAKASMSFVAPRISIETSARRWEQQGVLPTVIRMWVYRLKYFFGVSPETLYGQYYGANISSAGGEKQT